MMSNNSHQSKEWFTDQVRSTQTIVRAYIRRIGVRPESVDDIAQEAYIIAFKKQTGFNQGTDFAAWVCQIARRLVANERRTEKRRRQIISENITDLILANQEEVNSTMPSTDRQEQIDQLFNCISKLPERSQVLLRERYFEDSRPGIIASKLGLSSNQVRQRLLRLRRTLLSCLQHQESVAVE